MNLDDLNALAREAEGHLTSAENLSRYAKDAARLRHMLEEGQGGQLDLSGVPGLGAYECGEPRRRLSAALMELAPSVLRVIELQLEAEAKVDRTKAHLLRQQVHAAIVQSPEA